MPARTNTNDFRDEIDVDHPHGNEVRPVVNSVIKDDDAEFKCNFLVPNPSRPEMLVHFYSGSVDLDKVQEAVEEEFKEDYPDLQYRVLDLS